MPVVLQLNKDQTLELIRGGGLKVDLTDDQAIDVTAQVGQLLKSRRTTDHGGENDISLKKYKYKYKSKHIKVIRMKSGIETLSSKIYARINSFGKGHEFTVKSIVADLNLDAGKSSSVSSALNTLKNHRRVRRIGKGHWKVL